MKGPNIFVLNCPVGVEEEDTRHRLAVRCDESREYRVYLLHCFVPEYTDGGHADPWDYDSRLAEILAVLGLVPRDLYAQTADHSDGACMWRQARGRATTCFAAPAFRVDVEGLSHYGLVGVKTPPVLCLEHAAEVTGTASVLWPGREDTR